VIPDPNNPGKVINQNQNIGDINLYGVELGLSGELLSCLKGGVNYTYLEYENNSSSDKITNLPHHKVFGYLQYFAPIKGLSLLGSVEYNGSRYSSTDGVRVAEEYTLLNAKVIYEFHKGFFIEGGVYNITDENYAVEEGYPLEGRNCFMNLRCKF